MLSDIKEIKVLGAYIFGGFMFVYIYSRNIDPIGTTGLRRVHLLGSVVLRK